MANRPIYFGSLGAIDRVLRCSSLVEGLRAADQPRATVFPAPGGPISLGGNCGLGAENEAYALPAIVCCPFDSGRWIAYRPWPTCYWLAAIVAR
jgi:hypothetical protein